MQTIQERVKLGCHDCPWRNRRSQVVPSEGRETSPLMILGRNPGKMEDQQGRPFIGPAGKKLDQFLSDTGISRSKVYITNAVKCYGGPGDPCPTEEVFDSCEHLIVDEIRAIKPKIIITFGSDAYRVITKDIVSVMSVQGEVREFLHIKGILFFPMTHPSFWLRRGNYYENVITTIIPKLQEVLRELNIFDLLSLDEV